MNEAAWNEERVDREGGAPVESISGTSARRSVTGRARRLAGWSGCEAELPVHVHERVLSWMCARSRLPG